MIIRKTNLETFSRKLSSMKQSILIWLVEIVDCINHYQDFRMNFFSFLFKLKIQI
jgi:hypothetical protein